MFNYFDCFKNIKHNLNTIHNLNYTKNSLHSRASMSPFCVYLLCLMMLLHRTHFVSSIKTKECKILSNLDLVHQVGSGRFVLTKHGKRFVKRYLPHYRIIALIQICTITVKRLFWLFFMISYFICMFWTMTKVYQISSNNVMGIRIAVVIVTGITFLLFVFPLSLIIFFVKLIGSLPLDMTFPFSKVSKGCFINFVNGHRASCTLPNSALYNVIDHNIFASKLASLRLRFRYDLFAIRLGIHVYI